MRNQHVCQRLLNVKDGNNEELTAGFHNAFLRAILLAFLERKPDWCLFRKE